MSEQQALAVALLFLEYRLSRVNPDVLRAGYLAELRAALPVLRELRRRHHIPSPPPQPIDPDRPRRRRRRTNGGVL